MFITSIIFVLINNNYILELTFILITILIGLIYVFTSTINEFYIFYGIREQDQVI